MKKTITLILCAVMVLSMAACSAGNGGSADAEKPGDTMSLEEIFENILADVKDLPMVDNVKVEPEMYESFLFVAPIDGAEALASEGMINAVAHSAVLLRVPDGTDVEAVRAEIEANANPRKWVCVEAEKTAVVAHGNTILLVMSFSDITDAMVKNFDALWA